MKTGDTVYLKTGSPAMSLNSEVRPNVYLCQWFVGKKLINGHFRLEQLTKDKPNI